MSEPFDHTEVYRAQLAQYQYHGHALWRPDPSSSYGNIEIGDVGFFHEGAFKRLFNVIREDSTPSLPGNLERMRDYNASLEDTQESYIAAETTMASQKVTVSRAGAGAGVYV